MKVYLNSITGIEDAILSMYFSKRTWTPELNASVISVCRECLTPDGALKSPTPPNSASLGLFNSSFNQMLKIAQKHITLGRFIDFSFTVEGLHRGAQDDLDAHAQRFNNRIVRASTRLAQFGNEKSDFYKDKILSTDDYLKLTHQPLPNIVEIDGETYVRVVNGFVKAEYLSQEGKKDIDAKDVLRGLYMLSIPSNFIFKCNLTEFVHVYKARNSGSHANPELKECIEWCMNEIMLKQPAINRDYFNEFNML